MIYEPQEDSFLVEKCIKKFVNGKVLDLGCGTGILAKAALTRSKDILAADINKESVNFVKKQGINAIVSDLFSNINEKFDWIIFNPPYLPEDKNEDQESKLCTTGGPNGYETIEKFLSQAKKHLKQDGKILLLFSSLSGDILGIIKKYGFKAKLLEEKPLFFEKLYVYLIKMA